MFKLTRAGVDPTIGGQTARLELEMIITLDEDRLLSVDEAQQLLGGIGRTQLYHLLGTGQLKSKKLGKRRLIRRSAIDELIDSLPDGDTWMLDPDCRDGKHRSCVGGPCECDCHAGTK